MNSLEQNGQCVTLQLLLDCRSHQPSSLAVLAKADERCYPTTAKLHVSIPGLEVHQWTQMTSYVLPDLHLQIALNGVCSKEDLIYGRNATVKTKP